MMRDGIENLKKDLTKIQEYMTSLTTHKVSPNLIPPTDLINILNDINSASGVQPNKIPTTSSNKSRTNDAVNKCNQHNENGCSSSSGTACSVTSDEVHGYVKPPERQHIPKRCQSQEAIQRRS